MRGCDPWWAPIYGCLTARADTLFELTDPWAS